MDIKSRFTVTLHYKRRSSKNMKDFYARFQSVYPGEILRWQSDNGSENLGTLTPSSNGMVYPPLLLSRCPKINAYIERYNRTVQEEFIDNNLDTIHDQELFHKKLADWLIFYNTQRVHKGCRTRHGRLSH